MTPRTGRIAGGVVQEILAAVEGFTLAECYPTALLADCVALPDGVEPGWTAARGENGVWAFDPPAPRVIPPVVPTVSALGFLGLFSEAEQAKVFATVCPQAPELFGFLAQLLAAGSVQLTDPRVVAGVSLLGMGGLLAPSRPAQVLGNIAADAVSFVISRATESSAVRADAVRFDTARAVERPSARADAVSFDTRNATTEP